jgi:hypothetical protein
MALPSVQEMEAYIRAAAVARGINPDVAVRVARSEGLAPNTWQAKANLSYGREQSYGPFQLHNAPPGERPGMGNDFVKATGLDPSNPANWKQGVDFAMNHASKNGWGQWFGAKKIGITGKMGISGGREMPVSQVTHQPGAGASMGGFAAGPGAVAARQAQEAPYMMPSMTTFDPGDDWSIGKTLGGLAGGVGTPRQVQNQIAPPASPVQDYTALMQSFSQPGRALVEDDRKQFALPELGSLADLLKGVSAAG